MKPDKPLTPPATGKSNTAKMYDALLEPLPLPDVTESDTDTAWGLWEASVGGADISPEVEPPPTGFENTVPIGLDGLPPKD